MDKKTRRPRRPRGRVSGRHFVAGAVEGYGYFVAHDARGKPLACVSYDPQGRERSRARARRIALDVAAGRRKPGEFGRLPEYVRNPPRLPEFTLDIDAPPGSGARLLHLDGRVVTDEEFYALTRPDRKTPGNSGAAAGG